MSKAALSKMPGEITVWQIDKIQPYSGNAKIHDKVQVAKIAKSIKEFGWDQPIVVDADGVIIKGHGRRLAALSLDIKQVPVWVRSDLSVEQVRASRLADNQVAISDFDVDILREELSTLEFDLLGMYDQKELDYILKDLSEVNAEAFIDDIEAAVQEQTREGAKTVGDADERLVRLDKALGFSSVKGKDERYVAKFMAIIETKMKQEPYEAFISFVKETIGEK